MFPSKNLKKRFACSFSFKAVSAKINQILVPLRTRLSTGDHVEIITSTLAKPNPTWLNFVITGKARSQIRNYLRSAESKDLIFLGEKMLNKMNSSQQKKLLEYRNNNQVTCVELSIREIDMIYCMKCLRLFDKETSTQEEYGMVDDIDILHCCLQSWRGPWDG